MSDPWSGDWSTCMAVKNKKFLKGAVGYISLPLENMYAE